MSNVEISITRKLSETITYTIATTVVLDPFDIEDIQEAEINEGLKLLDRVSTSVSSRYAQYNVEKAEPKSPQTSVKYPGGKLSANYVNGAIMARVFTGPYVKYGVPIYPEILAMGGVDIETLKTQDYDLLNATIDFIDGKPKRVTAFTLKP